MSARPRKILGARRVAGALMLACALALTATASQARAPLASAAASASVKDEGKLHLVKSSGSTLYDEGSAHGSLPGTVKIRFLYDGNPQVSAQITIYAHGGSIVAHGSARLSSPSSSAPSFKGTIAISAGSGRYAHAHGFGRLYGVFYRRSYAITVQTEGTLHY
ncbi:MAG TPA: hypothetical protein VHU13_04840 [Solirubrobacteraceae bacterium]|nr:hypothetical protein [Solirubrobacteraceae bacterium]